MPGADTGYRETQIEYHITPCGVRTAKVILCVSEVDHDLERG